MGGAENVQARKKRADRVSCVGSVCVKQNLFWRRCTWQFGDWAAVYITSLFGRIIIYLYYQYINYSLILFVMN